MTAPQLAPVPHEEYLHVVEQALATITAADPALPVPLGPGYSVADVVDWSARFAAAATAQLSSVALTPRPPQPSVPDLAVAAPALLGALATAPPRRPCWTPSAAVPPQAQFWLRRSAHALSVRAWQVLVARNEPASLPSWLLLDGIDEHLQVMLAVACADPEMAAGRAAGAISVRSTDLDAQWVLRLEPGCVPQLVGTEKSDAVKSDAVKSDAVKSDAEQPDAELAADAATLRLGLAGMLALPQGSGEPTLLAALGLR